MARSIVCGALLSRRQDHRPHRGKHPPVEGLRFLKQIDREAPGELDVRIVAGNSATPQHPKVKAWLAHPPRFTTRFTPAGSSWMNLVERFFAGLTGGVVRGFTRAADLTRSIEAYLAPRNRSPKPHRWTAKGQEILEQIPPRAKLSLVLDYYYLFQ